MGPAPGLWKRKLPNGLGSWRVESVVDQQEPTSLFVFLFDDGSGEFVVSSGPHFKFGVYAELAVLAQEAASAVHVKERR